MTATILSGWREQYDRMHRSHKRLLTTARGEGALLSSDEARDDLVHFFQDAYYLKDWIRNHTPTVIAKGKLEGLITGDRTLSLCADLCNGTKHLLLTMAKTGDLSTAITSQSVAVRPAAAGSGQPPRPALYSWTVESGGKTYDVVALAGEIIQAWDDLLKGEGLLPSVPAAS